MQDETESGNGGWQEDITINVDESAGFYKKNDLGVYDAAFLLRRGYVVSSHVPLGCHRSEEFLLKITGNQSAEHFFLVRAINEYLEWLGANPKISDSFSADIRFVSKQGKRIAIEVETGVTFDKRKDLLLSKIEILNRYYDDWFFVVSNILYVEKYKRFGKVFTRTNVCRKLRSYFGKWNQKTGNFGFEEAKSGLLPAFKVKRPGKAYGW